MDKKIRVSACIVTYNNVKYIETAVATFLDNAQSDEMDVRLYVFDNGSTDGTVELLREKFESNPKYKERFKLTQTGANIGFGAAHNKMLDIMSGEFVSDYHCVVNPDVVIKDDILSKMVSFMERPENADVNQLSPRICFPDGRNQILGKRNPHFKYLVASRMRNEKEPSALLREYAMLDADYEKPFEIENATGCFMFFRSSKFKEVGGFDKRYFMYFEDCDITREMNKTGKVLFFPDAIVYHVWARDSKRNTKLKIIHITSMLKYFLKWRTF